LTTVNLSATLKDNSGNPLEGKPIKFYYSYDGTNYTLIATVNTNASGIAETTHTTNEYTWYKAVFEGDDDYESSEDIATYNPSSTWLSGWSYRKSHNIEGSTSGSVTDYQIRITVHYGSGTDDGEHVYLNGKCRSDFGDIRFTSDDGATLLKYWIEEKVDGDYAKIWVKVPSIPESPDTATIYIYYGNSSAVTTSNGEETFIFFDDFDTDTWSYSGSGVWINTSEGRLYYQSGSDSYAYKNLGTTLGKFALEVKGVRTNSSESGNARIMLADSPASYNSENNAVMYHLNYGTIADTYIGYAQSGSRTWQSDYFGESLNTAYRRSLKYDQSKIIGENLDLDKSLTVTGAPSFNDLAYIVVNVRTNSGQEGYYEWVAVRNYIDPEPTHGTWGSEEGVPEKTVVVSNESVSPNGGYVGDTITYTAIVKDEDGNPLPEEFIADLLLNGVILIDNQQFVSAVYDSSTGQLTLTFTVPDVSSGTKTVKLKWDEQTI